MRKSRQGLCTGALVLIAGAYGCAASDDHQAMDALAAGTGAVPSTGAAGRALGAAGAAGGPAVPGSSVQTGAAGARASGAAGAPAMNSAGAAGIPAAMSGSAGMLGSAGAAAGSGGTGAAGMPGSAGGGAISDAAGGAAGAAGGPPNTAAGEDACGADGMTVMGMTSKSGNGSVLLFASGDNEVLSATMTMLVPKPPKPESGVLFLWPGIQPSSSAGISGYGVLQPVLTWGSSCNGNEKGWWISGQYVYFTGGLGGAACEGGDIMTVETGDLLDIDISFNGMVWTQTITNRSNHKTVTFDRDLKGQKQVEVLWEIEEQTQSKPVEDVIFTNSVIKFKDSAPMSCVPRSQGQNDYVSPVRASADGKTCCIPKVILRSAGVMATTPDQP
jgi:hypothetical protein